MLISKQLAAKSNLSRFIQIMFLATMIFSRTGLADRELIATDYYQLAYVAQTRSLTPEEACSEGNMYKAWGGPGLYNIRLEGSDYVEPPLCTKVNASCTTNYLCWGDYISSIGTESSWRVFMPYFHLCPIGYQGVPDYENVVVKCVISDAPKSCGDDFGNPISAAARNKKQIETDYAGGGPYPLVFKRIFNSEPGSYGSSIIAERSKELGDRWRSNFNKYVKLSPVPPANSPYYQTATVSRPETFDVHFLLIGGVWTPDDDIKATLEEIASGWKYTLPDGSYELYNQLGRLTQQVNAAGLSQDLTYNGGVLQSVSDSFGHQLNFTHDPASGRLLSMTDPSGQLYSYEYFQNNFGQLGTTEFVVYPDNTKKHYFYNGVPGLSGIAYVDKNGVETRYSTYSGSTTELAITDNGVPQEKFTFTFNSDTQTTVTDTLGNTIVHNYDINLGRRRLLSKVFHDVANGTQSQITNTYDDNNNLKSTTDELGRTTNYTYNLTNQRMTMTEAVGTAEERTTEYEYLNADSSLRTFERTPSVFSGAQKEIETRYTDPAHPNLPTAIITRGFTPTGVSVERQQTLQYNQYGQLIVVDGPRTDVNDVTTFTYYDCTTGGKCGQMANASNALNQTTTYDTYDGNGRVTQSTDPVGVVTTYTYDERGRLATLTQTPPQNQGSSRLIQYTYTAAGKIQSLTTPDGNTLTYGYDAAQYLRSITDSLGNQITYRYDLKGNRTEEKHHDPDGTLVRDMQTEYDHRNRVKATNDAGFLTQLIQDAAGNLATEIDPNQNPPTQHSYDPLNRLKLTLDALGHSTSYQYDVNNQLQHITAPNGAITQYAYDDLGNLLSEDSADRGTQQYQYDQAGNLTQFTDARGVTVNYSYDALNRRTTVDYPGVDQDVQYIYDTCSNGTRRLCQTVDASGTTTYLYDPFGNITTTQFTNDQGQLFETTYTYDAGDRIATMLYPSGRLVTYYRDLIGRITKVTTQFQTVINTLAENISYRADGLINSLSYGNGLLETRVMDTRGLLTSKQIGQFPQQIYQYDANSNILTINQTGNNSDYDYDSLNRLTQSNKHNRLFEYSLDANGNRDQKQIDGVPDVYTIQAQSNRLESIDTGGQTIQYLYDANGNIKDDGRFNYDFGAHNRLTDVTQNNIAIAGYTYNANGQRTKKVSNQETTYYHYNLDGLLIAETDANGNTVSEYVYNGSELIATAQSVSSTNPTEIVLDNPDADFTDTWPTSTSVLGYRGANYQHHAGGTAGPGLLGTPVDNLEATYSGTWTSSTSVKQFYAGNYQAHAGETAGPGTLGTPVDNAQATYTGTWPTSTSVKTFLCYKLPASCRRNRGECCDLGGWCYHQRQL